MARKMAVAVLCMMLFAVVSVDAQTCSCTGANRPSASSLAASIKTLTAQSRAIRSIAETITTINGPLIILGQGPFPEIISRFVTITTTGVNVAVTLVGATAYPAANQGVVCNALIEFIHVHQALLGVLIDKGGLFSEVPLIGQPVAAVLQTLEAAVDTLAFGIVGTIPGCRTKAMNANQGLKSAFASAIQTYQGLNI
eukprot:jgi/Chlat1/8768/Chrsp90S09245